jgi:hypothetical protein
MIEDIETNDECRVAETDSKGNTNLCCCYILEADGRYSDPCYMPVSECCVSP